MDGSRTTPAARTAVRTSGSRWFGQARRREQLRLLADPLTRTAAAQVLTSHDRRSDAFDALYLRYSPYVAAIGAHLLGRDAELDDLVQDVFLQVLRGLSQLRDPAAFKGWLAQVTIRGATRRLRKRSLKRLLTAPCELLGAQAAPEPRMLSRQIYKQLDVLPTQARVIWILRHVEGEALHVIARRTGCSLAAVQRYLIEAQAAIEDRFLRDFAI